MLDHTVFVASEALRWLVRSVSFFELFTDGMIVVVVVGKSEFLDMDRINRCKIPRSTFFEREVGSDSLILGVRGALVVGRADGAGCTPGRGKSNWPTE